MKKLQLLATLFAVALGATAVHAGTISLTGTLSSPESFVEFTVTLLNPGTVDLQTYGFGGGTNAAGALISLGGTDPFLAIFSGTGSGATIVTDGSAIPQPYGTSLSQSNYGAPDFVGCGPANTESIGGSPVCGDITMTIPSLAAGTYTVLLSDGQYVANAVGDNGTLGEGFADFTGGTFCNIDINGVACPNDLGAYALDITTPPTVSSVPEPGTLGLFASGLTGLGFLCRRRAGGCLRSR
jgi:hypothetical protein